MKNKAKCNLCGDILTGMDNHIIDCKCGEISLDGINKLVLCKKSIRNYIEIDDDMNIIIKPEINVQLDNSTIKPTKLELLDMLDDMIKNIESLPQAAMTAPVSHYDLAASLILLSSILRAD